MKWLRCALVTGTRIFEQRWPMWMHTYGWCAPWTTNNNIFLVLKYYNIAQIKQFSVITSKYCSNLCTLLSFPIVQSGKINYSKQLSLWKCSMPHPHLYIPVWVCMWSLNKIQEHLVRWLAVVLPHDTKHLICPTFERFHSAVLCPRSWMQLWAYSIFKTEEKVLDTVRNSTSILGYISYMASTGSPERWSQALITTHLILHLDTFPFGFLLCRMFNPFTPESDQCQISPAAPPETLHHTVRRTSLIIAYSDERWL